jgi:hypothetical protein
MCGAAVAFPAVRLVRTQLYAIQPSDPLTLPGAVSALLVLGAGASFLPARPTSRIDPMAALRQE